MAPSRKTSPSLRKPARRNCAEMVAEQNREKDCVTLEETSRPEDFATFRAWTSPRRQVQ